MEGGGGEKTPVNVSAETARDAGQKRTREDNSTEFVTQKTKRSSTIEGKSKRNAAECSANVVGQSGGTAENVYATGYNYGDIGNTYNLTVNAVPQLPGKNIQDPTVTGPDPLHDILARTKDEVEDMTAGMIRVSAVDDVLDKLKAGQRWVTITGNAGDGKTTLGYLILKEYLQKDVNVYTIYKPKEYDLVSKVKEDMVIMFDDRFGAFRADEQKIDKWFDVIQRIFRCQKNKANNKVLFISRRNVVNESKDYLGHLTDSVFNRKVVVDLSIWTSTYERMKILEHHLEHENVSMNPDIKERVCTMRVAHGFPHCCKMIARFISEGCDVPIEQFFRSPLNFLDKTTKVLYKGKCRDLFQIMIKHDGKFDFNSIDDEEKRQKLLQVEKEQEGSYITVWRNGTCQFAHPSVYESVLNVINDIDPLYCVQYATLSVIRQKMIISTSDEEDRSRSLCYIIVKPIPVVLKALAERFREEILKGGYSVFTHRLCQSREFCEALVSCCVTTGEKENCSKRFINKPGEAKDTRWGDPGMSNEDTMLWTAFRSGNIVAVCVLMRAGADIQDVHDGYGRTPLHYLCQEKDSSGGGGAAGYDDDDDDDDDYDDDYDDDDDDEEEEEDDGDGDEDDDGDGDEEEEEDDGDEVEGDGDGDNDGGDDEGDKDNHHSCQINGSGADADQQLVNINSIRMIIKEGGGDVNVCDKYGRTPLHYLLKHQTIHAEAIKFIISGKGDINQSEQHKSTPLHYLCANSSLQLDTVDLVIKEGKGDFNKGDEHGTTPFHYFCENIKVTFDVVVQVVNTANGDINKQDDNGITPLHVLCKGSLPMENILTLINQGDKADMYGNTPLHFLCRRRGINAEILKQQLGQCPETDMKKQNDLGYTPFDYLTDQDDTLLYCPDDSLPWTDGMIARSAADLVVCRLNHMENRTVVLGREMILNSERAAVNINDFGRVMRNTLPPARGYKYSPCQFLNFMGTCSSPIPVPPIHSPFTTPPSYWETSSTLTWSGSGVRPLLEMGLVQGLRNMDKGDIVSELPSSVCVSVDDFPNLDSIFIRVFRRDPQGLFVDQVGERVTLSPPTRGVELTLTFGLVLDVGRGRVGFIDVERGELLCKLDLELEKRFFPMFFVDPDNFTTRMRLVSGREICVTDRKIQLIQQALSD